MRPLPISSRRQRSSRAPGRGTIAPSVACWPGIWCRSGWARGRLPAWARDLADTDELVQETLLQTLRNLDAFEPRGEGALQAYLRRAIRNRVRDELPKKARRPDIGDLSDLTIDAGRSPLEQAIGREAVASYERALAVLKPDETAAASGVPCGPDVRSHRAGRRVG
jgi:hypothetical protein